MNWLKRDYRLTVSMILLAFQAGALAQANLKYDLNETVTWQEAIEMYEWLDSQHESARLIEAGWTDAGKPLHLFVISTSGEFTPEQIHASGKSILFINNGIHPGEPCGVDASIKLARDLLNGADHYNKYLDNTVVVLIPIFNVGGALNRSPYHRANQNGPVEQGFRGNARNLDLNRDFIKLDSKNTRSLVRILRDWDPHIFMDTHTSNGADYPYTITLINSHAQRHEKVQAAFLEQTLVPALFEAMDQTPYAMSPYVWSRRRSPDSGILAFMDYPRYTSGYVSLFNTFAFTVETHMFKPFSDRVLSTWHLLRETLKFSSIHAKTLVHLKASAGQEKLHNQEFVLQWSSDFSRHKMIPFRGYAAKSKPSNVTGFMRQYYDRNESWEKEIPYYKYFKPEVSVDVPDYYIIPSAWSEVIERLKINQVEMHTISSDTAIELEVYYIDQYETVNQPYNGHYRHFDVKVKKSVQHMPLLSGDFFIPVRQKAIEYLVQTLEPTGYDSFFSWNFFDEILFRNEYFSPYIFEETAEQLLKDDPRLKAEFESKQLEDSVFASNPYLQLRYIYEQSPWSESTYMRYPVYRLNK